ncbi:type III secretion system actin-recruiting effector Tarp [Chlamydia sp. 12-01]|uniref:type III secretion system actin-recruiting effector Tarp n=1 Tax=Chlamydia sp. 12-01 TaxID=3002742 RepID=UPI0035D49613
MTSPINNPSTTNVTTTTTTTPVVTTSTSFGGHVVSTTGTEALETTAQTVSTTAEQVVSQAESDAGSVIFTTQRDITTTAPTTGGAAATATAASLLGSRILGTGRARTDSTSSSDSSVSDASSAQSAHESITGRGETVGTEELPTDVDLGSLAGLRSSEAADGAERAQGPGGLPSMTLPKYDPTDKASIIKFLSEPSVQAKLQTKANHIVFMDESRGSFIFVRNGDWSTAESIAVTNGKTKEPITDVKDLETCVAKFCVGYEAMQADWTNNIQPRITGETGERGTYDHLLMSMKFKTTVLYGPWNTKESSSNYTPSVWRRGTKCDSGPIWGDVGGLKGINWNNFTKPDEGTAFSKETGKPLPPQPQPGPYAPPIINVNLGGVSTSVNVTGGTTTTTVSSATTQPTDSSGDGGRVTHDQGAGAADFDDVETQSTSTLDDEEMHFSDDGEGFDSLTPAPAGPPQPPGPPPPAQGGVNITGMPTATLQQVLTNARQHLDTVYDQNGVHHQGSQDLGTVVRTSEDGTYTPTVLLNNNQGDGGRGVQRRDSNNDDDGNELGNILSHVRQHLDVVYPGGGKGEPIPVNQNLGDVIKAVESGNTPEPTQPEGVFFARRINIGGDSTTTTQGAGGNDGVFLARRVNLDENGNIVGDNARTSSGSPVSSLMGATSGNVPGELEHLLPQLRSHLDDAFDKRGNLITPQKTNVGQLIKAFQERTGSGGLTAPVAARTVVTSGPVQQQSATVTPLPKAQTAETIATGGSPDLHGAAQGVTESLSNLLQAATPSTGSTTVVTSGPVQQQSATIQNLPKPQTAETTTTGGSPDLHGAAKGVSDSLSNLLQSATPSTTSTTVTSPAPVQGTATSSPVAGTKQTAVPTTGGATSGIPQAAANVTATLNSVANKLLLFEKGSRLQEAIDGADTGATQGQQLLNAARMATTQLSKTLSKVTGAPPPPPQRRS